MPPTCSRIPVRATAACEGATDRAAASAAGDPLRPAPRVRCIFAFPSRLTPPFFTFLPLKFFVFIASEFCFAQRAVNDRDEKQCCESSND